MVYSSAENGSSADMALGFSPAGGHSYSLSRNHMSPEALCCRPVIFDEPNLFLEFPKLLETYQKLFKSAEHNYLAKVIDSDDPFLMHDQFVSVITVPQTGSPTITCSPSFHSGSLVYVQGNFDIFSIGHLRFLQEASKLGDSLLVGITPDLAVKGHKGPGYPLNNAYQRALTLLSYKCVTGVVLLPGTKCHRIDPHFLDRFGVATVCVGKIAYERGSLSNGDKRFQQDTFEVPKAMGILKIIDSGSMVTTSVVMDRILQQKQKYIERNAKKLKKGILSVQ